jgi:hypothetical protein
MPRRKKEKEESANVQLSVPSPRLETNSADVRAEFAAITKRTPRNKTAEQAFVASKVHVLMTHPTLHPAARAVAVTELTGAPKKGAGKKVSGPIPGGVGYGMFYNDAFKTNFGDGTAIYFEIICPNPPGGNVNTFLYLTATNRSAKGVEAFISYNGQNQTFFKVFDWARYPASPWQTNIPFANLGNYLRTESSHGAPYQVLPLMNVTSQSGTNYWYNQVWLWNHVANRWDLTYQYGYSATQQDQKSGWVGSWGPIVETFQNAYQGTKAMGALTTELISRSNNQWGAWHFLGGADSYIRTDNKGFHLLFLDANYNWAVNS